MIYVCAGWYGVLGALLFERHDVKGSIRSFDFDDSCAFIAETLNRVYVQDNWKFKASTVDVRKLTFAGDVYESKKYNGDIETITDVPPTCIINTSCEHIENFDALNWARTKTGSTPCPLGMSRLSPMLPRIRQDWTAGRILSSPRIRSNKIYPPFPSCRKNCSKVSIALFMISRLKLSSGACKLSSLVNKPSIRESKPAISLRSRMIGILPPSLR